ncbi:hypothetical protein [Bosea sp. PAMC 26642]|uniref:hypothetical protein n=1 Tax=Bosea sp. (strain PAMC 26642) TaxID=1792307 RepID=UPI000B15CA86|nr:hypothetical protein [Bosea sp. PAMC 26642]
MSSPEQSTARWVGHREGIEYIKALVAGDQPMTLEMMRLFREFVIRDYVYEAGQQDVVAAT